MAGALGATQGGCIATMIAVALGGRISRAEMIAFPLITLIWSAIAITCARRARETRQMLDLILSFDLPSLMFYTKGGNRELPPDGGNRG